MAKMSDKTKRAINKGRRKAGLKPIKFGAKKKKVKRLSSASFKKSQYHMKNLKKSGIGNW